MAVRRVVVILGKPLSDFAGSDTNHRIGVGVISRRTTEDLHADRALFDLIGVTL